MRHLFTCSSIEIEIFSSPIRTWDKIGEIIGLINLVSCAVSDEAMNKQYWSYLCHKK